MGYPNHRKIIILIVCFALTSSLTYVRAPSRAIEKQASLIQVLSDISGWTLGQPTPLDPRIVDSLELDDYVNHSFFRGRDRVSLYIGYYNTTQKVGVAHHPLVCFPGQGWILSEFEKGELMLDSDAQYSIAYSAMKAQRGMQNELIIYWFQSYDKTSSDTLTQKIKSLWIKALRGRQDNAFVRISISLDDKSLSEARETVFQFVRALYPIFMDYIKGSSGFSPA